LADPTFEDVLTVAEEGGHLTEFLTVLSQIRVGHGCYHFGCKDYNAMRHFRVNDDNGATSILNAQMLNDVMEQIRFGQCFKKADRPASYLRNLFCVLQKFSTPDLEDLVEEVEVRHSKLWQQVQKKSFHTSLLTLSEGERVAEESHWPSFYNCQNCDGQPPG
jgi:hypothetical protein